MSRYILGNVKFDKSIIKRIKKDLGGRCCEYPLTGEFQLIYGFDKDIGYFFQLFPLDELAKNYLKKIDIPIPLWERNSFFDSLKGNELGYIVDLFGGDLIHVNLAYSNQPF